MKTKKTNPGSYGFSRGIFLIAGSVAFASVAYADPLGANTGAIYRMASDANFQEGCFPPCMCPIMMEQPVLGTAKFVYAGFSNGEQSYVVEDVNWYLPGSNTAERIIGSGKYHIGTPGLLTVIQHRLELDLRVGDDPPAHFDSGWLVLSNSGGIDLTVSINGMFCWDRVIRVHANPVPASDFHRYALDAGSTFQRGCIDGFCDCAVGPELPMRGEFALVSLQDNSLFRLFAVVDVHWRAMSANTSDGIPISGVGLYWVGGEFAAQNRLSLELKVAGEEQQHYDSGMVVGGGQFPSIDVVTRTHTNCVDTVLHVVASPGGGGGEVCGGIVGIPCGSGEFCKLPPGQCCCDFQGICTPIAEACPEYIDPVCGCDGMTYDNPCFAEMAGQSIDYWGPCRTACGPNGTPCLNGEFCKFPVGSCGTSGDPGLCTPRPGACPDIWNPVCGCDDKTYGNECDADAAGVSLAHRGECGAPTCAATRILAEPALVHCDSLAFPVRIVLSPPNTATAIALEDSPPPGWGVSEISGGGLYDAANNKVKWGPFFPPFPQEVSYFVTPSFDSNVAVCFAGSISVDGLNEPVCGDSCLEPCCPRMTADMPHESCGTCPVTDCNSCDASICGDARIHMCEVVGYACAWLHGCHDDLSGMTRAAYLWRNGECYCWDDGANNWYPTQCEASPNSGCCPNGNRPGDFAGTSRNAVIAFSPVSVRGASRPSAHQVWVDLEVPLTASAVALEIDVPNGWKVKNVTDGGVWDAGSRKVKWGVFFDDLSRTVGFTAHGPAKGSITVRNGLSGGAQIGHWSGLVSIDGMNQRITAK